MYRLTNVLQTQRNNKPNNQLVHSQGDSTIIYVPQLDKTQSPTTTEQSYGLRIGKLSNYVLTTNFIFLLFNKTLGNHLVTRKVICVYLTQTYPVEHGDYLRCQFFDDYGIKMALVEVKIESVRARNRHLHDENRKLKEKIGARMREQEQ